MNLFDLRTGIGYDIHPLVEGRPLKLGGVDIAHNKGLAGHSDADVLCHAIADALLGAVGERDIGYHFPNSDEEWRGLGGLRMLEIVRDILATRRAQVINVDSSILAEAPRVLPYVEGMRLGIAEALAIPGERVGIKATTNERLGAIGRAEGIAAFATVLVCLGSTTPLPDHGVGVALV